MGAPPFAFFAKGGTRYALFRIDALTTDCSSLPPATITITSAITALRKPIPCLCFSLRISAPPAVSAVRGFGCGFVALCKTLEKKDPELSLRAPDSSCSFSSFTVCRSQTDVHRSANKSCHPPRWKPACTRPRAPIAGRGESKSCLPAEWRTDCRLRCWRRPFR